MKNTFIDIQDQEGANATPSFGARQRSSSAPPSLHGGCMGSFEDSKSDGEVSTQVCEEVSSLCGSGSSEADTSSLSPCQGNNGATRLKSSARAWQPDWGQELQMDDDSTVTRLRSSAKSLAAELWPGRGSPLRLQWRSCTCSLVHAGCPREHWTGKYRGGQHLPGLRDQGDHAGRT